MGRQQRRGPHRRQPDADRSEDRQARQADPGRRSVQHVFLAGRQVGDRRRRSDEAPRLPRSADDDSCSTRSPTPRCAGINHADFSIDGRYAIFTCEFTGTVAKIDLVERKVCYAGSAGLPTKRQGSTAGRGMPQDIRVSPDGKLFFVADMMADGVLRRRRRRRSGRSASSRPARARTASIRAATARSSTSPIAARTRSTARRSGKGSVSVIDFATRKVDANWPIPGGGSPDMGNVSADGK